MRFLAVLTVRNEAAFLLEWLAHHRAVGFTDFLVFSNDCQDGTDLMLDHLAQAGDLTHIRNDGPYDERGIQFTALKQAEKLATVQNADWIMTLDIDEFVNIHTGDGTLTALLNALPEASAIALTWRLFGNAGAKEYTDTPITRQFTRCAPVVMNWPWRAAMFKTFYRNDGTYRKLGVHRPRSPDETRLDKARWYDGEGRELGAAFRRNRVFSDYGKSNYALVQLNHYPLGAVQSYVLKSDRGRVNRSEQIQGLDYWTERNFNTDNDTTISRMAPASARVLSTLKSDPVLADLHEKAVHWRHARFGILMAKEPVRALYGRLLMSQPSLLLSESDANYIIKQALRAHDRKRNST